MNAYHEENRFNDIKLPFGLLNGKLVHVDAVENGKKCGCICPNKDCAIPLEARNAGLKNRHHFAHSCETKCNGGNIETMIHLMAKQIVLESGFICTPTFAKCPIGKCVDGTKIEESEIEFKGKNTPSPSSNIFIEKRYKEIVPDIIIEWNERQLFVEIFVSHKVNEYKKDKIEQYGVDTIEIDLSKSDINIFSDYNRFKDEVLSLGKREWVNLVEKSCDFYYNVEHNDYLVALEKIRKSVDAANKAFYANVERSRKVVFDKYKKFKDTLESDKLQEDIQESFLKNVDTLSYVNNIKLKLDGWSGDPLINVKIKRDWFVGHNRIAWQAYILQNYVFKNNSLHVANISKDILNNFKLNNTLDDILASKNKGYFLNDKKHFFLTDKQCSIIPSENVVNEIVIDYFKYLCSTGILCVGNKDGDDYFYKTDVAIQYMDKPDEGEYKPKVVNEANFSNWKRRSLIKSDVKKFDDLTGISVDGCYVFSHSLKEWQEYFLRKFVFDGEKTYKWFEIGTIANDLVVKFNLKEKPLEALGNYFSVLLELRILSRVPSKPERFQVMFNDFCDYVFDD